MSSSLIYEPSHEPAGRAIAEEEEEDEEDQERAKGDEEPPDGGEHGGGRRTVEIRGPVAPDRGGESCGPVEELGRGRSLESARGPPVRSPGREEDRLGEEERSVGARKKTQ
jgi:hypothetical protein